MTLSIDSPLFSPVSGHVKRIVVFLHGYGSNGADMIELAHEFAPQLPDTLFIAPHALEKSDIAADGYQWFGLPDFNPFNIRQGLDRATPQLIVFLLDLLQHYKLSPKDMALIGFSQGCILALDTLFATLNVGAIIGYSGAFYPPTLQTTLKAQYAPVLLVHGTNDTVVPYTAMLQAQTALHALNVSVQTLTCNGLEHSINYDGIRAGIHFLHQHFIS